MTGETQVRIVGILNVTPDSFSDGGRYTSLDTQLAAAESMAGEGASVIEVGGESTRPGASPVPLSEELERVIPVIRAIRERIPVKIGVDTSKGEVARQAIQEGVEVVNDVTALRGDPSMASVLAQSTCSVVLMHMKGTPRNMQQHPYYEDVTGEIKEFLAERIRFAEKAGIKSERIIVDPGIGFGKRVEDNLVILRDLASVRSLGRPVMVGASRKSFIGKITGREVSERETGTCAANVYAVLQGASYLRVHNAGAARDLVRLVSAIERGSPA